MNTPLKKHFYDNMCNNQQLIGMAVIMSDGTELFINDFDQMCSTDKLPRTLFASNKLGSNFGHTIDSDELFVKN